MIAFIIGFIAGITAYFIFLPERVVKVVEAKTPFKNQVVFEDIILRKVGSEVWAMYENTPQKLIIDSCKCFAGAYSFRVEYTLRKPNWSKGCVGIPDMNEGQFYNSKEELLKSL